jgi:hypothetical protein
MTARVLDHLILDGISVTAQVRRATHGPRRLQKLLISGNGASSLLAPFALKAPILDIRAAARRRCDCRLDPQTRKRADHNPCP